MPVGTPLHCIDGGTVTHAGPDQYGGNYIDVKADSDGGTSRLLHLDSIVVKKGDKVSTGQLIGYSGNTGLSTAPHLHLEFVAGVDPVQAGVSRDGIFDHNKWKRPSYFAAVDENQKIETMLKNKIIQAQQTTEFNSLIDEEKRAFNLDTFDPHFLAGRIAGHTKKIEELEAEKQRLYQSEINKDNQNQLLNNQVKSLQDELIKERLPKPQIPLADNVVGAAEMPVEAKPVQIDRLKADPILLKLSKIIDNKGRILGVSKKLTALLFSTITGVTMYITPICPPEYKDKVAGGLAVLGGFYIGMQAIVDMLENKSKN
jgi:hypothetical protein